MFRRVIEARDTLEAELKHSEHSFAGMLEGILDQKLDQMVHVIQEGNLTRSLSGSTILSPGSQATSLNAQQVFHQIIYNPLSGTCSAFRQDVP